MKFKLLILFTLMSAVVYSAFSQNKIYNGPFKTYLYDGTATYEYLDSYDVNTTRMYNGEFKFKGNLRRLKSYADMSSTGGYIIGDAEKVNNRYRKLFCTYGTKIEIEGTFKNNLKDGDWIFLIYRYNPNKKIFVVTDETKLTYREGVLNGNCSYKLMDLNGKILKTEIATFVNDKENGAVEVTHYENSIPKKYISYYRYGEPIGEWKMNKKDYRSDYDSEGMIIWNFNSGIRQITNDYTGEVFSSEYGTGKIGKNSMFDNVSARFYHYFVQRYMKAVFDYRIGNFHYGEKEIKEGWFPVFDD